MTDMSRTKMQHYTITMGLVGGYLPNDQYCTTDPESLVWEVERATDDIAGEHESQRGESDEPCDCDACTASATARAIIADGDYKDGARVMVSDWDAVWIAPCNEQHCDDCGCHPGADMQREGCDCQCHEETVSGIPWSVYWVGGDDQCETCRYCGSTLHWSDVDDTDTSLLVGPDGQTLCLAAPGIAGSHAAS